MFGSSYFGGSYFGQGPFEEDQANELDHPLRLVDLASTGRAFSLSSEAHGTVTFTSSQGLEVTDLETD